MLLHLLDVVIIRKGLTLSKCVQIQALVVNHGSRVYKEDVKKIKQPTMFNGSDNDKQIPHELLDEFRDILAANGVTSDIKVNSGFNYIPISSIHYHT